MTYYINTRAQRGVETVDEFSDRREAFLMLREYLMSAPSMGYYLSTRCTAEWKRTSC